MTGICYTWGVPRRADCLLPLLLLAACSDPPRRGAIATVPAERVERPESGAVVTQPKPPPPPPVLPPPTRASLEDEVAREATSGAQASQAEQLRTMTDLHKEADQATAKRSREDVREAERFVDSWEVERARARGEALTAERERWTPRRAEGVEEWLGRARAAAGGTRAHPTAVAAEARRQAGAARENATRAEVLAAKARREADDALRFARVTVREWVLVPGTASDLERTEARAVQLELEALRVGIAADWAEEAAERAAAE